ncbi:hypothetical protein [Amycolatopsis nigrescens]|uniref:hypothetical protein n=1 Tax=Amycolatopsis nigrescens TaxID=381445 RepID=UPI000364F1D9|nr:hypothetical protein [Amycolatopsis nigrescens]
MRPMLSGYELPQVQELRTADLRALAEHKPPGKDGSLLQNLGRAPTAVTLWGMASDRQALELLDQLKKDLRTGVALPFTADITTDTEIEQVVLDDLQLRQLAGRPDRYAYALTLREYIEPVEPAELSGLDLGLLEDAAGLLDDVLGGLELAQAFASGLERFVGSLTGLLGRLTEGADNTGG